MGDSPLQAVNNYSLESRSAYANPSLNVGGAKILTNTYPIQSGNFGSGLGVFGAGSGAVATNNRMEFDIVSSNAALLLKETYLTFDIAVGCGTTTTGVTAIIDGAVDAIFKQVQLSTIGGYPLDDTQPGGANLHSRIMQNATISSTVAAGKWDLGMNNLGIADASFTTVLGATATQGDVLGVTQTHYNCRIPLNCFKELENLALPIFGGVRLVFLMEKDSTALYRYGAGGVTTIPVGYAISNPVLKTVLLPYNNEYLEKVLRQAEVGNVVYAYSSNFYFAQGASTSNNLNIQLQRGFRWANSILWVQRLAADENTVNKDFLGKYQAPAGSAAGSIGGGLALAQVNQGGVNFPYTIIDREVVAYREMLKVVGQAGDESVGNQITRRRWSGADITGADQGNTGPLFMIGIDLSSANGAEFSGIDTNGAYLTLRYNQNAAPASVTFDSFVNYSNLLIPRSKQLVELLQ